MFKKCIIFFSLFLFLAGCGEGSKIEKVISQRLKDPNSVQFKDMFVSSDGKRACITWNAKNSMGGYGEWDVAVLNKANSEWEVETMEGGSSDQCTQNSLDIRDNFDRVMDETIAAAKTTEARQQALAMKQNSEYIPNELRVKIIEAWERVKKLEKELEKAEK